MGNTGAKTPDRVDITDPNIPDTATSRHTNGCTATLGSFAKELTAVHVTTPKYAGTTCHRVPSNLACAKIISNGAPLLICRARLCLGPVGVAGPLRWPPVEGSACVVEKSVQGKGQGGQRVRWHPIKIAIKSRCLVYTWRLPRVREVGD